MIKILHVKMDGIENELRSIRQILEQILLATEPPAFNFPYVDDPDKNIQYHNERDELIREALLKLGKQPK